MELREVELLESSRLWGALLLEEVFGDIGDIAPDWRGDDAEFSFVAQVRANLLLAYARLALVQPGVIRLEDAGLQE